MRRIFISYRYEKIEQILYQLGLIEQPTEDNSLDEMKEMTFEIRYVDLEQLQQNLKHPETLLKFSDMLHLELRDNSWYEIFDSVSG